MLVYQRASTNLFLNSDVPVTQDITVVSGQTYCVWVLGAGSITLSNAATDVVTEAGGFVTFTAASTTLTCTYSATLTHVQVEAGETPTGMIITTGVTASTDETINTWDALNHGDTGRYSMTIDYAGGDADVLSLGGTPFLYITGGNIILDDGVNQASAPITAGVHDVIVLLADEPDKMSVQVDANAKVIADYDGSVGTGDIVAGETVNTLERYTP